MKTVIIIFLLLAQTALLSNVSIDIDKEAESFSKLKNSLNQIVEQINEKSPNTSKNKTFKQFIYYLFDFRPLLQGPDGWEINTIIKEYYLGDKNKTEDLIEFLNILKEKIDLYKLKGHLMEK